MKIAILSRNGSIYSTKRLHEAATKRGHQALVIDHTKCSVVIEKKKPSIMYGGTILSDFNAIIPRIGSSVTFYGTAIVRQFEMMKVFSTAESQAIIRSRDKLRSLQIFSRTGLGIPKTVFAKFPKNKDVDELINSIGGAPVIIKLLEGTQGLGVILADTATSARSVIEAFSGLRTNILIQEYVKEAKGADIRAFVINGEVVGAMERTAGKPGEFRSNLHRGGKGSGIKLTRNEKSSALKAAKALGLTIAGVDMLRSSRGPLIIEVNSSPGLEGIEAATGLDIAGKIIQYVEDGVAAKKIKVPKIKG
jgi:ribosomal protein S6--L-glutamate ligase